jgi:exopolyphosphatase/guanosine-5'-triphosphate,3'-diphosphate pyrophosphatase
LRGLAPDEIDIVALVARYHRGAAPKKRHREFGRVSRRDRRTVRCLAAMLRVADGLDRSHFQTIRGVKVEAGRRRVTIGVEAREDAEIEIFTARRKGALFERVFGRTLDVATLASTKASPSTSTSN